MTADPNSRRAISGAAAVAAGTPDLGKNGADLVGVRTDASDAITNILHHLADAFARQALEGEMKVAPADAPALTDLAEAFALAALDQARSHFTTELRHLDD